MLFWGVKTDQESSSRIESSGLLPKKISQLLARVGRYAKQTYMLFSFRKAADLFLSTIAQPISAEWLIMDWRVMLEITQIQLGLLGRSCENAPNLLEW